MPGPAYPGTAGSNTYSWDGDPKGTNRSGYEYCSDVEKAGRDQAKFFGRLGWVASVLAIGTATTPAVISAVSGDELSQTEKALNIVLPVTSAFLTAGALALFTRESHDNQVAKEASLAMLEPDEKAAEVCISAVADWHGQRGDASEAVRARMANGSTASQSGDAEAVSQPAELEAIPSNRRPEVASRLNRLHVQAKALEGKPAALEAVDKLSAALTRSSPNLSDVERYLLIIRDSDVTLAAEHKALEESLVNILAIKPAPPPGQ